MTKSKHSDSTAKLSPLFCWVALLPDSFLGKILLGKSNNHTKTLADEYIIYPMNIFTQPRLSNNQNLWGKATKVP